MLWRAWRKPLVPFADPVLYWRTGWRESWIAFIDLFASRYGWSIEYIESVPFEILMNLYRQCKLRPHFLASNKDDELEPILTPEQEEQFGIMDADLLIGKTRVKRSWEPKVPDPVAIEKEVNVAARGQLRRMLRDAGVPAEVLDDKVKHVAQEAKELHKAIDEQVAILYNGSKSPFEKTEATREILRLRNQLEKIGAIVTIEIH